MRVCERRNREGRRKEGGRRKERRREEGRKERRCEGESLKVYDGLKYRGLEFPFKRLSSKYWRVASTIIRVLHRSLLTTTTTTTTTWVCVVLTWVVLNTVVEAYT